MSEHVTINGAQIPVEELTRLGWAKTKDQETVPFGTTWQVEGVSCWKVVKVPATGAVSGAQYSLRYAGPAPRAHANINMFSDDTEFSGPNLDGIRNLHTLLGMVLESENV